jgi:hypothetical protein
MTQSAKWLRAMKVSLTLDVYSVSSCVNDDFADYVDYWKHNDWWFFDSPAAIQAVSQEHSIDLGDALLFYYEIYEFEFDHGEWRSFSPGEGAGNRQAGIATPSSKRLDGYDAVMRVGELLIPIAGAMQGELLAGSYIQADETPVGVQTDDQRGRNHQPTCGSLDRPGKESSSTSAWAAIRKGRSCSWAASRELCRPTAIRPTTRSVGRRWCTPRAWRRKFVEAVKVNAKNSEAALIPGQYAYESQPHLLNVQYWWCVFQTCAGHFGAHGTSSR